MNGMDMNAFRKSFQDQAERQVKVRLALEHIAKEENIVITDGELETEFNSLATQNGLTVERVKEILTVASLKGDLATQRAVELIKENAKPGKKTAAKKTTRKKKTEEVSETAEESTEE